MEKNVNENESECKVLIKKVNKINNDEIEKMFCLHSEYFANAQLKNFIHDLKEKDWCILITDETENVKGYSTIQLIDTTFEGREIKFLFSGDTLVAKENWHDNLLSGAFGQFILYLNEKFFDKELYWLLISKGFRTYRFLPVYYKEYYPVHNRETPQKVKALMDHICLKKFGASYDSQKGLVVSNGQTDYLKPRMAVIPDQRKSNPHVRFFLNKNPNYYRGDELVCIANLGQKNIKDKVADRVIRAVTVNWVS